MDTAALMLYSDGLIGLPTPPPSDTMLDMAPIEWPNTPVLLKSAVAKLGCKEVSSFTAFKAAIWS
jgi:hypothetical protein